MNLLYPSDPLRIRQPDAQYAEEVDAVRAIGFNISVFSFEDFQGGNFRPLPALPEGTNILYRGWMMSALEYKALVSNLIESGTCPITSVANYLASHHLPNWYPLISDLTPETRTFPADCDLEAELRALAWPEFFIKDYVKSLKTSAGSRISKPEQISAVIADMKRFRGIIEGGFCVRRVEEFLPETERRYFVADGVAYSGSDSSPPIVTECAKHLKSPFYSVDVVQRTDGKDRVVEVGDGQVSDLVGWTPEAFAKILAERFRSE